MHNKYLYIIYLQNTIIFAIWNIMIYSNNVTPWYVDLTANKYNRYLASILLSVICCVRITALAHIS